MPRGRATLAGTGEGGKEGLWKRFSQPIASILRRKALAEGLCSGLD